MPDEVEKMLAPLAEAPPTATEEIIEIAIGIARVFGELDEEAAQRYIAPDFVDHEASPGVAGGPEGYLTTARYMRNAFSEATWQVDDFISEGDKFACRVTFSGKHTGDFLGLAPTGAEVKVQHLHFYRVADGKAVEHWGARDELTLLRQIGQFTPEYANPADAGAAIDRQEVSS
ncbi:ester cyclase [Streptosporangium saharense]|uniref:ester cyclase n=1 Tax=Streptosporangium saharense TaxID=1706840 RepID=UPI00341366D0